MDNPSQTSERTRFTGHLIDPEFQTPEPEEVASTIQEVVSELPAFQEFQREHRLADY